MVPAARFAGSSQSAPNAQTQKALPAPGATGTETGLPLALSRLSQPPESLAQGDVYREAGTRSTS